MLGRRSPEDLLPPDETARFLAFRLAQKSVQEYHWILDNLTELEIWEAWAMNRVDYYLSLEDRE